MDKLFLTSQTYTLLCKTDVERAEWKEAIIPLLEQIQGKKKKKTYWIDIRTIIASFY